MASLLKIEKGIEIQSEQLEQWKKVLLPEVHAELVKWATKYNSHARTGFDITRGSELSSFLSNYMLGHTPDKISQQIAYELGLN